MAGSFPDSVNPGLFLPTTPMFDVGNLQDATKLRQLLVQLIQSVNNMAIVVNQKDSALYVLQQFVNGQTYFADPALTATTSQTPVPRQVYRLVINFGQLPNAGVKVVAHNIAPTAAFTFTRIYATASDTAGLTYIPIPYIDTAGEIIALLVNNTDVVITTNFNASNYNVCYVVLEFLKQ